MKVFISWSGHRSKEIATLIHNWLEGVIQGCTPWMSAKIPSGASWFTEIGSQLSTLDLGIVCLTPENKNKPWILFESGAIANKLNFEKVCTFLINLEPEDIEQPLAQFNHTMPSKEGVKKLVETINKNTESPLKSDVLNKVFERNWPDFEENYEKIANKVPDHKNVSRTDREILTEMLETVRGLEKRLTIQPYTRPSIKPAISLHRGTLEPTEAMLFAKFAFNFQVKIGQWEPQELSAPNNTIILRLAENIQKDLRAYFSTDVDIVQILDKVKEEMKILGWS